MENELRRWIRLVEGENTGLTRYEIINETFNLADVVIRRIGDSFVAYWNDQKIGYVTVDYHDKSVAPDARHIYKSGIQGGFRRRGVATKLYDAAADALKKDGLRLVPSPQSVLSDDAFEFWKKRDPASVAGDKRHSRDQYGGKIISHNGSEWVIDLVGQKFAHVRKNDDSGVTTLIPTAVVYAAFGPPTHPDTHGK